MKKTIVQSFIMLLLFSVAVSAQFKSVVEADMDSAATLSGTFDMGTRTPVAFYVPGDFIGSKLYLWFNENTDSAGFKQYYLSGSAYEVSVTKDMWLGVPPADVIQSLRYLRVTSDSAQTSSGGVTLKVVGW